MALSAALTNKMTAAGVGMGTPGWTIVQNANFLPPIPGSAALIGDTDSQALRKLMNSYYTYGRASWTWAQSATAAAANGGLVKGLIAAVACGSFNQNFKWLAENGLGINGMGNGQETSNFITYPNKICIDSKWIGNVRTSKDSFQTMQCFKFTGHYWVTHGGINYDVCYNNTFTNVDEIVWTKLTQESDVTLTNKANVMPNQLFKLDKPMPNGTHLIMIQQAGNNGWPNWQLVTRESLMAL